MFCKNCGKELNDGAQFCTNCGTRVNFAAGYQQTAQAASQTKEPNTTIEIEGVKYMESYVYDADGKISNVLLDPYDSDEFAGGGFQHPRINHKAAETTAKALLAECKRKFNKQHLYSKAKRVESAAVSSLCLTR